MRTIRKIVLSSPFTPEQIDAMCALVPEAEWHVFGKYGGDEESMRDADVILGNVPPELLPKCEKLQWLHLCSAGTDGYMDKVPEGAVLTCGTGAYGPAISEHMLAMLLAIKRDLFQYRRDTENHVWNPLDTASTVYGSTVLVLGLGNLGGNFARRVKAMDATVIGVRRAGRTKPDYCDELYLIDDLDNLLPRADVIAMCLPNTASTQQIMNAERLARVKPGAILLNVGRGSAIDQKALREALDSGRLAAAGLDVVAEEPLPATDPLWGAKNLLITPHVSGGWRIPSVVEKVWDIMAENLRAWLEEKPLRNVVDRETGYRATNV